MAWYRTPRQCQRLRIRMLRPGRARTFVPAPARYDIPMNVLFFIHFALRNAEHFGVCWQLFGSGISKITPLMSGPSKPCELDPVARRQKVRALLIQAALWAPTMNEKDAILEAMQEQQDWEDAPLPRWPGDADFQLLPT